MKKISKVFLLITVGTFFCMNVNAKPKKNNKKAIEKQVELTKASDPSDSREIIEKELSNDEKEIYNYVISVLLQQNKARNSIKVIDGNYQIEKIPTDKIVCMGNTITEIDSKLTYEENKNKRKEYFLKQKEGKYEEAFNAYIENNKIRNNISSYLQNDNRVILTQAVYEKMGEFESGPSKYWEKFFEAAPDSCGYLYLSNIGFDNSKSNAIIEIKFRSGAMSGYVNYLVFGKNKDNKWEVVDVERIISY